MSKHVWNNGIRLHACCSRLNSSLMEKLDSKKNMLNKHKNKGAVSFIHKGHFRYQSLSNWECLWCNSWRINVIKSAGFKFSLKLCIFPVDCSSSMFLHVMSAACWECQSLMFITHWPLFQLFLNDYKPHNEPLVMEESNQSETEALTFQHPSRKT